MQVLSTRTHGAIDYVVSVFLIVAPYLFGFADGSAAQWVPVVLGVAGILYSLATRYELGAVPLIPMPAHLGLDVLNGAILASSPWVFGFSERVYLPHLVIGIMELLVVMMSEPRPRRNVSPA